MIQFNRLTCGGRKNPRGTSRDILLGWSYRGGGRNAVQSSYAVTVSDDKAIVWESGTVLSDAMQCAVPKDVLKSETVYTWTLETVVGGHSLRSADNIFETAADDLMCARYITYGGGTEPPAVAFARDIRIGKPLASARLYVTGLGFFLAEIDGKRLTDARMLPPNTPYQTRWLFETLDMTPFLKSGCSRLTLTVGGGYNMDFSQWGYRYDTKKGVRALAVLRYTDGTEERIPTDADWFTVPTGFRENAIYGGETYDASFTDDGTRLPVTIADDCVPKGVLCPDELPPVLPVRRLDPISEWTSADGGVIFDFGENIAGVTEITVSALKGHELCIRHSELIDRQGELNYKTNRAAKATDRYICRGDASETWSPSFTYHGFRYIKVFGTGECTAFSVCAVQLSAEAEQWSDFSCSDPTVNRIHALSVNSMRANHFGIPTDCPVRDERTPCMMDSQMYERSAMYTFGTAYPYYRKWLDDVCFEEPGHGNPDWHGDVFSLVRHLMEIAGDIRPAVRHYDALLRFLHYYTENWKDGLWTGGYGDWCAPNEDTWETFFSSVTAVETALMYWDFDLMHTLAGMLGKDADAAWIADKMAHIRTVFRKECVRPDGFVNGGRQAELCVPLYYGLLGDKETAACLSKRVRADTTLDTGAYGTPAIGEALADNGYVDDYFAVLTQTAFPGYGWQIANGATSLWEQWAYDGNMHSHSHAFFAGADASFYRIFCGIRPTANGFRKVRIAPCLPEGMSFAECTLGTVSGTYRVNAEKISGGFALALTVPPNTSAEIVFPTVGNPEDFALFDGERNIPYTKTLTVGGGVYRFRAVPKVYLDKQVF